MKHSCELITVIGTLLVSASMASAKDADYSVFSYDKASPPAISKAPRVQVASTTRAKEYIVDTTGTVRPEEPAIGDINLSIPNDLPEENGASKKVSNFDNLKGNPKCGPSPLSVEQIITLIEDAARRHNVDPVFAKAVGQVESRFDRNRNSDAGARGPMQLIPATARRFGVNDICDPGQNIEGGVKFLRALFDEFKNPVLVAAAYNSGEGRIYEYSGVPPFPETVRYVASVINLSMGLDLPSRRPSKAPSPITARSADTAETTPEPEASPGGRFVDGVWNF